MATLAAVDIGSNALRLRIIEAERARPARGGPLFLDVRNYREAVRLGLDVFNTGRLGEPALDAACAALARFCEGMREAGVERYRAVATSAAREAKNGAEFTRRAEQVSGLIVERIDGEEEARLVRQAVAERVTLGDRVALLVDLGGGSAELTLVRAAETLAVYSLPLGTVRMLDFAASGGDVEVRIREVLAEPLRALLAMAKVDVVVGSGGNVETLADLCPTTMPGLIDRAISMSQVERLLNKLRPMSLPDRMARYGLRPDRADTIVPATLVLRAIAEATKATSLAAPGVGLKEGVLLELARDPKSGHALP